VAAMYDSVVSSCLHYTPTCFDMHMIDKRATSYDTIRDAIFNVRSKADMYLRLIYHTEPTTK